MRVDRELVQRVEWSAARHAVLQAEQFPDARVQLVDGGALVALGAGRYVNRGVGVGLGARGAPELLDALEAFFADAALPPMLEVSPWVPDGHVDELRTRGYTLQWFRNVYARPLTDLPAATHQHPIDVVDDDATAVEWKAILGSNAEPGSAARVVSDEMCDAVHQVPGAVDLVVLHDHRPIACGSLTAVDGIGWLGGAATLPEFRGRGAQYALLVDRLHRARRAGCDLAAATALAAGQSARNLERIGFTLLHTQAVMARP